MTASIRPTKVGDLVLYWQYGKRQNKGWRVAAVSEVDDLGYAVKARRAMYSKVIPLSVYPTYICPAEELNTDPHVIVATYARRLFDSIEDARAVLSAYRNDIDAGAAA